MADLTGVGRTIPVVTFWLRLWLSVTMLCVWGFLFYAWVQGKFLHDVLQQRRILVIATFERFCTIWAIGFAQLIPELARYPLPAEWSLVVLVPWALADTCLVAYCVYVFHVEHRRPQG